MFSSILAFSGIFLLGSFVQSLTGFGLSLVSVSLLSMLLDPKLAVPLAAVYGCFVTVPLVIRMWPNVRHKEALCLAICALPGAYLGAATLKNLQSAYILLFMGALLVVSSVYSLAFKPVRFGIDNPVLNASANGAIGFLAGALGAAVGGSGPPVILWLSARPWQAREIKATLSFFFMMQAIGAIIVFAFDKLLNMELLRLGLYALPGLVVGTVAGILTFDYLHKKKLDYHKIVHALLVVIGIRLIWRSVVEIQV